MLRCRFNFFYEDFSHGFTAKFIKQLSTNQRARNCSVVVKNNFEHIKCRNVSHEPKFLVT